MALIGAVGWVRAAIVFVAQILGSIAASAVVLGLFPGPLNVTTTLSPSTSIAQGLCKQLLTHFSYDPLFFADMSPQSLRCFSRPNWCSRSSCWQQRSTRGPSWRRLASVSHCSLPSFRASTSQEVRYATLKVLIHHTDNSHQAPSTQPALSVPLSSLAASQGTTGSTGLAPVSARSSQSDSTGS